MKLKVIPVFQFLIAVVAIMAVFSFLPSLNFTFQYQQAVSYVVSGIAFLVLALALSSFQKAETTVDPAHPDKASSLVTGGIYKITRNPMYLAMLLLLVAFVIGKGNPIGLLAVVGFVASMTAWQIKPEEEALTEIFGQEYIEFKKKVRRWI